MILPALILALMDITLTFNQYAVNVFQTAKLVYLFLIV